MTTPMLRTRLARLRTRRLDQRGIALPIALLGLVAVSLLVTAALLTSTTEAAISNAQTDAAQRLYDAEGAVQRWVSSRTQFTAGNYTVQPTTGTRPFNVDVARLAIFNPGAGSAGYELMSVRAEPQGGGRSLVAMLRVPVSFLNMNINAGASFGTDATISGSIDVNSSSNLCSQGGAADAVVHAAGTSLTIKGAAKENIGNDTSTFAGGRDSLAASIMNGMRLQDLAKSADIKFRQSKPDSAFSGRPSWNNDNPRLRWGCPNRMATCTGGADTTYYPLVVINAANADGTLGEVSIQGDHGQGMLVVLGGNLRITGNFVYKGIILVEGATDIHGGGSGSKIEGALIGLGTVKICNVEATNCQSGMGGTESDLSSGAVIQYNRCAITSVQQSINQTPIQGAPGRPTFAWFEVVR